MIRVENLTVAFDDVLALQEVDLSVDDGEFVTVIGPSGCGKTTLLRTVAGLQEPADGRVRVDGASPDAARSAAAVGYVFQDHTLYPWQTALENVTFLREMAGKDPDPDGARDLLAAMGLGEVADARPAALSGGMKQRVAIARAVHLGAPVLLMDEPFGELDELTRERVSIEVREFWRETDKTVLFVTHSVPEAVLLGDRCVVMHADPGRVDRVVDVSLERPRESDVVGTEAFQREVASVRRALAGRDR